MSFCRRPASLGQRAGRHTPGPHPSRIVGRRRSRCTWAAAGTDERGHAAILHAARLRRDLWLSDPILRRADIGPSRNLTRTRDLCEQHGVRLEMVALPFLTSSHIDREKRGAIMLGESPQRDRDIDDIHQMIAACAKGGVPAFKYNMSLLGVLRTRPTPGRGGSTYSTWRLAEARSKQPLTRAGHVTQERPGSGSLFPRPRDPGLQRTQNPRRLPSARSGRPAGRLSRRLPRAGDGRRAQEIRLAPGEPLPRP